MNTIIYYYIDMVIIGILFSFLLFFISYFRSDDFEHER